MAEDNTININQKKEAVEEIAKEIVDSKQLGANSEVVDYMAAAQDKIAEVIGIRVPQETLMEISMLFALPDDKFQLISEEFLQSFTASLNNPADKLSLCQALTISNVKIEDLTILYEQWNNAIDTALEGKISDAKRDFLKKIFGEMVNAIMDAEGISKRVINISTVVEDGAIEPKYARLGDAGADICALEDVTLMPGETKIVRTGIKMAIPTGYELQVRPRSGISAKSKLRIANTPGTIDSGYRDEIGIICENIASPIEALDFHYDDLGHPIIDSIVAGKPITIEKGQRIAQIVLNEIPTMNFVRVSELDTTIDRNGGFGSTGI